MQIQTIGEKIFTHADQEVFAALSGDWNPIHVDPVAARRTIAGEPIVHGCHTVLWALECFFAAQGASIPSSIEAVFQRPVYLDTPVAAKLSVVEGEVVVAVSTGETPVARLKLAFDEAPLPIARRDVPNTVSTARTAPEDRPFETLQHWSADISLGVDHSAAARRFPLLWENAPGFVALFCSLSRVVGMECPGLRSLFSRLSARTSENFSGFVGKTVAATREIAPVRILLEGEGIACDVDAFYRPAPVGQPSIEEIARRASTGVFSGTTALVIGGSRGLGEATAKLIAASGGDVILTYSVGRADAERVVAEIRNVGGKANALQMDALAPRHAFATLEGQRVRLTHLFYFATPRISGRRTANFDADLHERFSAFFVTGFVRAVEGALRLSAGHLRAFYPSSVFVDAPPQSEIEYAAAKAAGESVARSLERCDKRLTILVERLPRTATDQTATILGTRLAYAVDVMASPVATMYHI